MARSYPIWVDIHSCAYRDPNKSYGIKENSKQTICVGTNRANSHEFAKVAYTHRKINKHTREYRMYVDGIMIKRGMLHHNEFDIMEDRLEELEGELV